MADNDVKIHVSADADLRKIEEAQRRIKELHRAADAYEANEKVDMSTAAKSARADARALERDVARWTKERAAEEKRVTQEIREQTAQRKAGISIPGRSAARAVAAGEQILSGGNPASSASAMFIQAAASSLNPLVIGAAIAGAIATTLASVVSQERDKDTSQGIGLRERSFGRSYQRGRNASAFGSSSALVSSALDADAEIATRQAARAGIDERARQKWYDPSTWTLGGLRKNDGQREREKNEAEIADFEKQKEKDLVAAQKKFMAEEGGARLRSLRGRSQRTLEGAREALKGELGEKWFEDYKAALNASGSEKIAKEMADTAYKNTVRDRQASAGAALVDARSGGAESAAAAQWGRGSIFSSDEALAELRSMNATVQQSQQTIQLEKLHK